MVVTCCIYMTLLQLMEVLHITLLHLILTAAPWNRPALLYLFLKMGKLRLGKVTGPSFQSHTAAEWHLSRARPQNGEEGPETPWAWQLARRPKFSPFAGFLIFGGISSSFLSVKQKCKYLLLRVFYWNEMGSVNAGITGLWWISILFSLLTPWLAFFPLSWGLFLPQLVLPKSESFL